jgi:serine/threonine protein phosphatase 1
MTHSRTIAIGDIHGCSAALAALIQAIVPTLADTLLFLGDYIDRGADSRGVLEQVIALAERCTVVRLLGNHEEMLLAALEGQSELRYWLKFCGQEALASYGHKGAPEPRPADLRALIPAEHIEFIKSCQDYFETAGHIFVDVYYEPDRPLHEQKWGGLRWASLPRVPARHCSGKVAIVGHTPQTNGDILDLATSSASTPSVTAAATLIAWVFQERDMIGIEQNHSADSGRRASARSAARRASPSASTCRMNSLSPNMPTTLRHPLTPADGDVMCNARSSTSTRRARDSSVISCMVCLGLGTDLYHRNSTNPNERKNHLHRSTITD